MTERLNADSQSGGRWGSAAGPAGHVWRRVSGVTLTMAAILLAACSGQPSAPDGLASLAGHERPLADLRLTSRRSWTLSERAHLLVLPTDNPDLDEALQLRTQRGLQTALAGAFAHVDLLAPAADNVAPVPHADYAYLVQAQLLRVDERRSSWQEWFDPGARGYPGRDRIRVLLRLYRAADATLLDSAWVEAAGPRLAWRRVEPLEVLDSAFRHYASQLSAAGASVSIR